MNKNNTTEVGGQTTAVSYEYDSLDRLKKETRTAGGSPARSLAYNYDLAGNRTSVVESDGGVASTNTYTLGTGNRLAAWGTGSATYDTAGNTDILTFSDGTTVLDLDWDERYRLVNVDAASSRIAYAYDVQGRKISRYVAPPSGGSPTAEEHYIYDGNQIVADTDASGNLLRTYVWGTGIDNLLAITLHPASTFVTNSTPLTLYPIKDHQNTVIALTDGIGSVVEFYEYDAYGNTAVFNTVGTELTESAIGNRYTFQGREIDWDTGLMYFRARWYSPEMGHWLSKDPIGISGGLNLYEFCGSNPVNFVDPEGLTFKSKAKAAVLAARIYIQAVAGEAGPEIVRVASKGKAAATQIVKKGGKVLSVGGLFLSALFHPTTANAGKQEWIWKQQGLLDENGNFVFVFELDSNDECN